MPTNLPSSADLTIRARASLEPPTYAIDLNVFYDFVRERVRSLEARTLVRAALSHDIRLVVTSEFSEELKRTSRDAANDPVLSFAKSLPTLRTPEASVLDRVSSELATIVFGEKSKQGRLSANDKSDVAHIALAVASSAAGYITSDEAILRAREEIFSRLGLDVIGLTEFASMLEEPAEFTPSAGRATSGFAIATRSFGNDISDFLASNGMNGDRVSPPQTIGGLPPRYIVAHSREIILGVLSIDQSAKFDAPSQICLCVEQDHPYSSTIIDSLLDEVFKLATQKRPASLALSIGSKHLLSHRVAISRGFSDIDGRGTSLTKVVVGVPLVPKNWLETVRRVERVSDIHIQHEIPRFVGGSASIRLTHAAGRVSEIDALVLETLLGPTLLALPGRVGTLVPIAKNFSDQLIGGGSQLSFLEDPEAAFLSRRTYFNSARTTKQMVKNSIVIFYESLRTGGRGAAIAAARMCDSLVVLKDRIPEALQRGGVVSDATLLSTDDEILATTFDNLVLFKRPVRRDYLFRLKGVAARNFRTATAIGSESVAAILEYGCLEE